MARRLARHVDWDLVERIEAGGSKPQRAVAVSKTKKTPRGAASYRGARRNEDRRDGWPAQARFRSRPQLEPIWIPLNRSRDLPFAQTYARAREIADRKRAVGAT